MLTDSKIKAAKPRDKPYRITDARGLRLQVSPAGGKHWQLKYRLGKGEQIASLGSYEHVGLAEARKLAEEARALVKAGIHPRAAKLEALAAKKAEELNSFGAVVSAWLDAKSKSWAPYTQSQARASMGRYILANKELAAKPIRQIQSKDIRVVLQSIAQRSSLAEGERKKDGAVTVARNVRLWCRGVFDYALQRDLVDTDPTYPLRNLAELKRPSGAIKHNKNLSRSELRLVLKAIDGFTGTRLTGIAVELLMLFFVRTRELTEARWAEFDLNERRWHIPAARMKARKPHMVPIATQAMALLVELKGLSGKSEWLFPNQRSPGTPMSNTTINRALERMGLNGSGTIDLAAHGFRGTASTHLHETGKFRSEVIEIQLAHTEKNAVKAAYNSAKYVAERTEMMQFWADYLDSLRAESVPESTNPNLSA